MSSVWKVQPGECIASIAYDHGLDPEAVWQHAENTMLRTLRKNPNTLVADVDEVYLPDKESQWQAGAVDKRHRFTRSGVPVALHLRFVDVEDKPRQGLAYKLIVGDQTFDGNTDDQGVIKQWIMPNAEKAQLTLQGERGEEIYPLAIGSLPPLHTQAGVLRRLQNLGYILRSNNDTLPQDELDELVSDGIKGFQSAERLTVTGVLTDAQYTLLQKQHGY